MSGELEWLLWVMCVGENVCPGVDGEVLNRTALSPKVREWRSQIAESTGPSLHAFWREACMKNYHSSDSEVEEWDRLSRMFCTGSEG